MEISQCHCSKFKFINLIINTLFYCVFFTIYERAQNHIIWASQRFIIYFILVNTKEKNIENIESNYYYCDLRHFLLELEHIKIYFSNCSCRERKSLISQLFHLNMAKKPPLEKKNFLLSICRSLICSKLFFSTVVDLAACRWMGPY